MAWLLASEKLLNSFHFSFQCSMPNENHFKFWILRHKLEHELLQNTINNADAHWDMHATFQMVAKKKLKECNGQFIVLSKAHHSLNKHAYLWQGLAILKFICKKRWKIYVTLIWSINFPTKPCVWKILEQQKYWAQ